MNNQAGTQSVRLRLNRLWPGVLKKSDRIAVEITARLMAQIREGDSATAATQALLTSMLQKLGQTPTGRNYVSIPAPETINPFAVD